MTTQSSTVPRWAVTLVTVAAALLMAGCVAAERASTQPPPEPTYVPPAAPAAPATPSVPGAAARGTAPKVSATTASEEELFQALTRAGVTNAARWTEEVIEYRPYPANDPNLSKLRTELAKYNPGQDTVDKIVSALSP